MPATFLYCFYQSQEAKRCFCFQAEASCSFHMKMSSAGSAGIVLDLFQKSSVKEDEVFLSRRWEWQLTSNQSINALSLAISFLTVGLKASLPREVVQSPSMEIFKTRQDKALSNLAWSHSWYCLEQEAELQTSFCSSNTNCFMILFSSSILNLFCYHLWLLSGLKPIND